MVTQHLGAFISLHESPATSLEPRKGAAETMKSGAETITRLGGVPLVARRCIWKY
jgi:hypothetical protein